MIPDISDNKALEITTLYVGSRKFQIVCEDSIRSQVLFWMWSQATAEGHMTKPCFQLQESIFHSGIYQHTRINTHSNMNTPQTNTYRDSHPLHLVLFYRVQVHYHTQNITQIIHKMKEVLQRFQSTFRETESRKHTHTHTHPLQAFIKPIWAAHSSHLRPDRYNSTV